MQALQGQYQAGMLETFKVIGAQARQNKALDLERTEALQKAQEHHIENKALRQLHTEAQAENAALSERVCATDTGIGKNPQEMADKNQQLQALLSERRAVLSATISRAEREGEQHLERMLVARQVKNTKPRALWKIAQQQHSWSKQSDLCIDSIEGSKPYRGSLIVHG